jgi:hypothetical protein
LEEWAKRDSRIKIHTVANEDWSDVQSIELIKPIACEYIYRMDSDDYLKSGFLARMLPILDSEKLDMLFFEGETIFQIGDLIDDTRAYYERAYKYTRDYSECKNGAELFAKLVQHHEFYASMCLYLARKSYLDKHDPPVFEPRVLREGDNYVSLLRLLAAKKVKVISEVGYIRRLREGSLMMSAENASSDEHIIVVNAILGVANDLKLSMDSVKAVGDFLYWKHKFFLQEGSFFDAEPKMNSAHLVFIEILSCYEREQKENDQTIRFWKDLSEKKSERIDRLTKWAENRSEAAVFWKDQSEKKSERIDRLTKWAENRSEAAAFWKDLSEKKSEVILQLKNENEILKTRIETVSGEGKQNVKATGCIVDNSDLQ